MNGTVVFKYLVFAALALLLALASSPDESAPPASRLRADYRADKAACASVRRPSQDACFERERARRVAASFEAERAP